MYSELLLIPSPTEKTLTRTSTQTSTRTVRQLKKITPTSIFKFYPKIYTPSLLAPPLSLFIRISLPTVIIPTTPSIHNLGVLIFF